MRNYVFMAAVVLSLVAGLLAGSYITGSRVTYLTTTTTLESVKEVTRTFTFTITEGKTVAKTETVTKTITELSENVKALIAMNPIAYSTCVSNKTEPSPNCDSTGDLPLTAIDVQIFPLREITILIKDITVLVNGEELSPTFITITDEGGNPLKSATLEESSYGYKLSVFIQRIPVGSDAKVKVPYKAGETIKELVIRPAWVGVRK